MRNRQDNDQRDNRRDAEPRWLHGHHHGNNSDRGNYTVDSHFNRGKGDYDEHYLDYGSFNSNADQRYKFPEGRFQVGGAQYMGEDYTRSTPNSQDNMYGMTYVPNDDRNSSRHYDPNADYSNTDYSDLNRRSEPRNRYGLADERFGHDVDHGSRGNYMGHSSMGDHESYRRYEQNNRMYDNDYSGGFAGRNYTDGADHYGEDRYYSNLDRWRGEKDPGDNYGRSRGSNQNRNR